MKVNMKALHIIANVGYTDQIMDILRTAGATGSTIVHARGEGSHHHSFLGITLDFEREIIISVVNEETAERILADVAEKLGCNTEVHGICYMMPVEKAVGINLSTLR